MSFRKEEPIIDWFGESKGFKDEVITKLYKLYKDSLVPYFAEWVSLI